MTENGRALPHLDPSVETIILRLSFRLINHTLSENMDEFLNVELSTLSILSCDASFVITSMHPFSRHFVFDSIRFIFVPMDGIPNISFRSLSKV